MRNAHNSQTANLPPSTYDICTIAEGNVLGRSLRRYTRLHRCPSHHRSQGWPALGSATGVHAIQVFRWNRLSGFVPSLSEILATVDVLARLRVERHELAQRTGSLFQCAPDVAPPALAELGHFRSLLVRLIAGTEHTVPTACSLLLPYLMKPKGRWSRRYFPGDSPRAHITCTAPS